MPAVLLSAQSITGIDNAAHMQPGVYFFSLLANKKTTQSCKFSSRLISICRIIVYDNEHTGEE